MLFNMDSLYESSKKLLYYLTHLYGYNNFIVDEVDAIIKEILTALENELGAQLR